MGGLTNKLPPVVDVEVYGCETNSNEIIKQLKTCLDTLEEYYQVKPIIYTTYRNYTTYIKSNFDEHPLWIRNVYFHASIITKNWIFWQYSDNEKLNCYDGKEDSIDMNVFNGNIEELEKMIIKKKKFIYFYLFQVCLNIQWQFCLIAICSEILNPKRRKSID